MDAEQVESSIIGCLDFQDFNCKEISSQCEKSRLSSSCSTSPLHQYLKTLNTEKENAILESSSPFQSEKTEFFLSPSSRAHFQTQISSKHGHKHHKKSDQTIRTPKNCKKQKFMRDYGDPSSMLTKCHHFYPKE